LSEGGYQARDNVRYSTGSTGTLNNISISSGGTVTSIASIRIKSGRPSAVVIPSEIQMIATSSNNISYFLILNGSIASPSWSSYSDNSNVEIAIRGGTISGGTILKQGYLSSSAQVKDIANLDDPNIFNFQLGVNINGTSDIVTLGATANASATVAATLGWYELN